MSRTRRKHTPPLEHRKGRKLTRARALRELAAEHAEHDRCQQTGKIRYDRHQEAAAALAVQARLNKHQPHHSTYRCPMCDGWHLSTWAPGEYKRARNGLDT